MGDAIQSPCKTQWPSIENNIYNNLNEFRDQWLQWVQRRWIRSRTGGWGEHRGSSFPGNVERGGGGGVVNF